MTLVPLRSHMETRLPEALHQTISLTPPPLNHNP